MADSLPRSSFLGTSPGAVSIRQLLEKVATSNATVLINGESGTGKELVARTLHEWSDRRGGHFVPINCGAIPKELLESELFGHMKGSFTGAITTKAGLFEIANGGSIFLDEIGETTPAMQVKLLRVLQEGEVTPVGSFKPIPVSVRVIAATHRPLEELVREGKFREDLYYRINVFRLHTAPLRSRSEDIPELIQFILAQLDVPNFELTAGAIEYLQRHTWPGNIRELRNTLERAVIEAKRERSRTLNRNHVQIIGSVSAQNSAALRIPSAIEDISPEAYTTFISESERNYIQSVLQLCHGNMTLAAQKMGLNRATLYRKLNTTSVTGSTARDSVPGLTTATPKNSQEHHHAI